MWAIVTSAVYHPYLYIYGENIYSSAPLTHGGGDYKPTDFSVSGVVFDGDHDFEAPTGYGLKYRGARVQPLTRGPEASNSAASAVHPPYTRLCTA